ncbi:LytTr DNA-binding domain-containing protein [Bradyrhizobium lablabi]|uniref:LytTr DNA-binding domain-containing protein n=1 Tax=Bradyrhizobium lablabi TaxID=722472 RepID=A0A1M6Y0F2_9BRAD|nr:LytTR family DNA-binding domain-containing protein [Bradyrhizobium lablabi]SHL11752.1 LytTr DNA-binding domain-containing protein [Bradyrhizobium lablabi]
MNYERRIEPHDTDRVEPAWDDRAGLRDEPPNGVTEGWRRGATRRPIAAYGWVALLIVASGIVNVLSAAKDLTLSGGAGLGKPILLELTSAVAWIAFLPLLRYGVAQLRGNRNRPVALAVALVATLLYAFLHLVMMVLLRKLAFALVAQGYNFHWAAELPYEFRKDVVSALMIAAVFWLIERSASTIQALSPGEPAAEPANSTADTLKQGLWLRDGPTSFHIDPRDLIAVTSAGNYVEFNLPAGRRLIRGTLAAEEARLKPFGLARVHRTRLANLNRVVAVELRPAGDFVLRMDNGETIAGSRRYRSAATSIRDAANKGRPVLPP